jgi:lipoyl(octanoyl) transferase
MTKRTFDMLDVYFDEALHSAALNMAVDEALLETATTPTIRFYGWAEPAVSFGYFGKFYEAAEAGPGRDLVRRWTGGGIVLHGTDLTYSVIVPATNHYLIRSPLDLYADVHAAIRETLLEDGANAVLASIVSPKISDECFANPVRSDILIDGKKVAGAAQRRTRKGLLQQGSIQYPILGNDFAARFAHKLCPAARRLKFSPDLLESARRLAFVKYGTQEWLRRR